MQTYRTTILGNDREPVIHFKANGESFFLPQCAIDAVLESYLPEPELDLRELAEDTLRGLMGRSSPINEEEQKRDNLKLQAAREVLYMPRERDFNEPLTGCATAGDTEEACNEETEAAPCNRGEALFPQAWYVGMDWGMNRRPTIERIHHFAKSDGSSVQIAQSALETILEQYPFSKEFLLARLKSYYPDGSLVIGIDSPGEFEAFHEATDQLALIGAAERWKSETLQSYQANPHATDTYHYIASASGN